MNLLELSYIEGVGHVCEHNGIKYTVNNYSKNNILTINDHIFYIDFNLIDVDSDLIKSLLPFTSCEYKTISISEKDGEYAASLRFRI